MSAGGAVLVVDDDVMVRDVVGRYLGRGGYDVTVAGDGEEALRAAEASPPDLVVLDLMLPGPPGLGVPAVAGRGPGAGRHAHRPGRGGGSHRWPGVGRGWAGPSRGR